MSPKPRAQELQNTRELQVNRTRPIGSSALVLEVVVVDQFATSDCSKSSEDSVIDTARN